MGTLSEAMLLVESAGNRGAEALMLLREMMLDSDDEGVGL